MKQPDDSISNVNGKSAVRDERTQQLFSMSDDLIRHSKRIIDSGKILREHIETLKAESLKLISNDKKLP